MSHLIDVSNNRNNMAYTGKTPWHGLGENLPADASLDVWRVAAGLDWEIASAPVTYDVGGEQLASVHNQRVLFRSDTKKALGIVSQNRYNVVQPNEVLEFYRDLVGVDNRYSLETAGALDGGKKIWALARYNDQIDLAGDIIKPYLLLATANDGSMSTVGQFTSVRVVCNNTLQLSLSSDKASGVRVPHSRDFDSVKVKDSLGLIDSQIEEFSQNADTLAAQAIDDKTAVNYFAELYAKRDKKGELTNAKTLEKIVNEITGLYKRGPGANLASANGTKWGALNAVTRYVDHHSRARSANNRFNSGQFGLGANTKRQALELIAA